MVKEGKTKSVGIGGSAGRAASGTKIRTRVFGFVVALIVLSLLASSLSLLQISKTSGALDSINRVSLPLNKVFAQLQIDVEVFRRESMRGIGSVYWNDPHWIAKPIPGWVSDVVGGGLDRASKLVAQLPSSTGASIDWKAWSDDLRSDFERLKRDGALIHSALERKDLDDASKRFPAWNSTLDDWGKKLQWGIQVHEQSLRERFTDSQSSVQRLRTGLEMLFIIVVGLSLLMLWLGERALRPLDELTRLARSITERGLKRGDKEALPELSIHRDDEVSALAREFHRMATQLLEWEKVVDGQKRVLSDQNQLLKDKVELQEKLKEIEHLAAVGRLSAQVAHEVRNPLHSIGLEAELALESSPPPSVKSALQSILSSVDRLEKITENYLRLSRMGSGEKTEADLAQVLENVLATYSAAIEKESRENGLRIDWKREGESPLTAFADSSNLEQAIGNLLRNALQSGAKRILFRLGSLESGRVFIRIEDDGPGVPQSVRERLFTPFSTTKAQGTGLGLSFVKKVAEEHQGEARFVERTELGGAGFELILPSFASGHEIASEARSRVDLEGARMDWMEGMSDG
jgi:signal transduction histidine kinase